MGGRRKLDWIQFGIMLAAVIAIFITLADTQGRITAKIEALQEQVNRIDQRMDRLEHPPKP